MRRTTEISEIVGRRILRLRRSASLTREQLAEACQKAGGPESLSAAAIANIETGRPDSTGRRRRDVTVDELSLLAQIFGLEPWALTRPSRCETCLDAPPQGFTCNECGTTTGGQQRE